MSIVDKYIFCMYYIFSNSSQVTNLSDNWSGPEVTYLPTIQGPDTGILISILVPDKSGSLSFVGSYYFTILNISDEDGKLYPPPQGWDGLTFIVVVDSE
jgi:hypothetical protein